MALTYDPIATNTLGSDTASVTFSSIPTTYTDLILVINGYINTVSYFNIQVGNGSVDTNQNYSFTRLIGYSGGTLSDRYTNQVHWQPNVASSSAGICIVNIFNYSNTTTNKTSLWRSNNTGSSVEASVGLWRSTSAINIITLTGGISNTFKSGTTFTLYGVKANA